MPPDESFSTRKLMGSCWPCNSMTPRQLPVFNSRGEEVQPEKRTTETNKMPENNLIHGLLKKRKRKNAINDSNL